MSTNYKILNWKQALTAYCMMHRFCSTVCIHVKIAIKVTPPCPLPLQMRMMTILQAAGYTWDRLVNFLLPVMFPKFFDAVFWITVVALIF